MIYGRIGLLLIVGTMLGMPAGARPAIQRDVEGYAVATCLGEQASPALKEQADGWGSIIVQRGHGGIAPLTRLAAVVKREVSRTPIYQIEDEQHGVGSKAMPVAFCAEIIDRPVVHAAIARAMATLAPAYRRTR